jgi:glycosyltransferase involved in cell wall biosynthesis
MKILFLIPSLANGGQEKAGMILTNYLGRFHDVKVVSLEPANEHDYPYQSPVTRIEIPRARSVAGKVGVVLKRASQLRKIKKAWKPDVSIAFGSTAMLINNLSGTGEKRYASIRQSLIKMNSDTFFYKQLFRHSGTLVPVHNQINQELWDLYGIRNHLFAYNGYDIAKITADASMPVDPFLSTFFNGKVLSHMGRFDSMKCNWQLVKVFHEARQTIPDLRLLMVGDVDRSNPVNENIYQFCLQYLRNNGYRVKAIGEAITDGAYDVIMTGQQSNPHRYIARSDLFVFTSAWEGFPNALVEAMACGLPVISADCPTGPREILSNESSGETYGLLMPVFDHRFVSTDLQTAPLHRQWASAIIDLFNHPANLQQLKQKAAMRARDFSVEISCSKWLGILEGTIR